ncbi:o-succinylbenzoate synthase [Leekyejoonella antrihumi]|uniref:o-succinylbenzoate synthase n=1 Tax=Leekyejoonella antrihumi TaxID=1660198 RepID=A0A563DYB2_9MICO|nr:o-succinylbenzoate synthase [Leekyejoonella antrihumi]TWP34664.1 O-succinylbenzoate synthase [Leekyejoonella antrihumi]
MSRSSLPAEPPVATPRRRDVPPLVDVLDGLRVVSIPLHTKFRGVTHREIALLQGPTGWGEFSPFLEYEPHEASRWLASAIASAWEDWPAPVRDQVAINATVPAVAADRVASVLSHYDGCRTAKVKVAEAGQTLQQDVDRVAAVRATMGPDARIRVDANGGWTVDEARTALSRLCAYDLEYAEQPCATVEGLRDLRIALARQHTDVLVAADESIRKAEDPMRLALLEAADVAVVKVAPLGGVRAALEVAQRCGLPIVVSSALDSSVGIAAGVALAATLPQLPFACGLGTVNLFEGDVTVERLVPQDGVIEVRRPAVDEAALDRWQALPDRVEWWIQRVHACHDVLIS